MRPENASRLIWLTLLLLAGAALRLHDLGRQSFWLDEAYTWYLTRPSWREIWGVMLLISDTSPLYYVAARLFVPLAGRSEFALRFAALCAGLLAVPAVYRLGRSMFGRAAGLWAAALLALSPFAVWYARDARPYGFYLLFAALALWGFWRWAEEGRGAALWVVASAALYLTHYASALFALAQAAYLVQRLRERPALFRRWFAWQALAASPTVLYGLTFLLRRQPITANIWIPTAGLLAPLQTLLNFLTADGDRVTWLGSLLAAAALIAGAALFAGRVPAREQISAQRPFRGEHAPQRPSAMPPSLRAAESGEAISSAPRLLQALRAFAVTLAGRGHAPGASVSDLDRTVFANREQATMQARRLLLWWLCLPMLATWLLSFRLPAYVDRFFLPEILALVILLGAGLARMARAGRRLRWAFYAAAFTLTAGMLVASLRLYTSMRYAREDWRGAARFVESQFPDAPLLAQDSEILLGLAPYRPGNPDDGPALPASLDGVRRPRAVVLRSPHESNHAVTKSEDFDPLTESPLASWFASNPQRILQVERFTGVGVVIVAP